MGTIKRHVDGRIISFAQCGEDMVLWRAFSTRRTPGFYVDIGANHAYRDSVTKIFYDAGWSGINVEPVVPFHESLQSERERDINLLMGASDQPGQMVFHLNRSNLDLSTFESAFAEEYRARGDDVSDVVVPVVTLRQLLEENAPNREIDFLKVDTEGHEHAVIRGNDWSRFRPKIVVLETSPANAPTIMELMESVGYKFTLNDGVNRWFVRPDCFETLGDAISYPASPVLDWYHPSIYIDTIASQHEHIMALQAQVAGLEQIAHSPTQPGMYGKAYVRAKRVLQRLTSSKS
jgi:FkbM family methyltransferase